MRKILLIVLIATPIFFMLIKSAPAFFGQSAPIISSSTPATSTLPTPTPTALLEIKPALPITISIPKLGIENVTVEQVGLDAQKRMDVPKLAENVAWYNLGARPGQKGSAVMAGHLDERDGSPAVFYNISKLAVGDEVIVTDQDKNKYVFKMTKSEVYAFDKVPLQTVFARADIVALNLITCQGAWSQTQQNYSQRRVVYTELYQIITPS